MNENKFSKHRKLKGNYLLAFTAALLTCAVIVFIVWVFRMIPAAGVKAVSSSKPAAAQTSKVSSSSAAAASQSSNSQPNPEYYKSAVFIGDSITNGMTLYGKISKSEVLSSEGMTAYSAITRKYSFNGTKQIITDTVVSKNPERIYVLLGSNDIANGYSEKTFIANYGKLVSQLRTMNPTAKIYVQSIFPVTAAYESGSHITNMKIDEFNTALKQLCKDEGSIYLDVASVLKDADGKLPGKASGDGLHLKKAYYQKWFDYLAANQ